MGLRRAPGEGNSADRVPGHLHLPRGGRSAVTSSAHRTSTPPSSGPIRIRRLTRPFRCRLECDRGEVRPRGAPFVCREPHLVACLRPGCCKRGNPTIQTPRIRLAHPPLRPNLRSIPLSGYVRTPFILPIRLLRAAYASGLSIWALSSQVLSAITWTRQSSLSIVRSSSLSSASARSTLNSPAQ